MGEIQYKKYIHKLVTDKLVNINTYNIDVLVISFLKKFHNQILEKSIYQVQGLNNASKSCIGLIIHEGLENKYLENIIMIDISDISIKYRNIEKSKIKTDIASISAKIVSSKFIYKRYAAESDLNLLNFFNEFDNIITEHQTKELEQLIFSNSSTESIENEVNYGKAIRKKSLAIVGVTREITEYQAKIAGFSTQKTFTCPNGIHVNSVKLSEDKKEAKIVNCLVSANFRNWHGIDRIINGLEQTKGNYPIIFHLVGESNTLNALIEDINKKKLHEYFRTYGHLKHQAIDKISDYCDIGIGSLGLHRMSLKQASVLKNREYCARGLPFIYSFDDCDFPQNLEFTLQFPADDTPLDIHKLYSFAYKFKNDQTIKFKMREYAIKNLDWDVKMKKLSNFIDSIEKKTKHDNIQNDIKYNNISNDFINPQISAIFFDRYLIRKEIYDRLKKNVHLFNGNLLDIGCGSMPYKDYILSTNHGVKKYIGLDFPQGKYAEQKQPDLTWDGTTIPLPDKSIDCAMATEVLEHCYEPLTVLKEVKRVLKPNGLFFFTTPFLWPLHDVPHDHFRYTPFSLERLLSESVFEDIQIKPLGGWNASLAQMLGLWLRRAPLTDAAREQAIGQLYPLYQQLAKMPEIEPESEQARSMAIGWSGIAYCPNENCDNLPEIQMDKSNNPRICFVRNKKFTYSETFIEDHINYISTNSFVIYGNPYPIYHENECLLKYENITEDTFFNLNKELQIEICSKILKKYAEENKIDVLFIEYGNFAANIYKACEHTKIPYIIHFHGYDASANEAIVGMKKQYLEMFKSCKKIIVVSKKMEETLLKIGAPKEKVTLNPYGVSIKHQNKTRSDYNQPVFLAVGRFVNKKAPHLTIKAFSKAFISIKNAKLIMVGDGPLLDQCKKLVQSLKIENSVHFAGIHSRRSVAKFMSLSRAFVQHSVTAPNGDCEGLPLAILEAGAMGLPVISTRHAGIPDAVIEGEHGFLMDELDVNAMAQAMRTLGNDPDLACQMGNQYRLRIENNFSRNRSIQNLRRIIQDALSTDQQPESNDIKDNSSSGRIDFLACERHNYKHLLPVWSMIPENLKGNFYILTTIDKKDDFTPQNERLFFCESNEIIIKTLQKNKNILITSSFYDKFLSETDCPLIFISHGGGQTYIGQNEYQLARRNYVLDLLPNHHTEKVFSERYPYSKKVVIGSPKMDTWHVDFKKPKNEKPVIAISFHFDRKAIPESRSTWEHFSPIIRKLARQDKWTILGHGHPRMIDMLAPAYNELGIETVLDFEDVLKRADLYICDHMSTLYEFASTDRPVVVLNAPWYRREVEHGLRFWEHADVGINCDHPDSLFEAIEHALADSPEQKAKREKSVNGVYAYRDGQAAQRAAQAIVDFSAEWNKNPRHLYPNTSEDGILTYLNNSDISAETVAGRAEYHKNKISTALTALKSDTPPHISDLEFHFWALALLLCKLGKAPKAKIICAQFYQIFGNSETLSTIFKHTLLAPAPKKNNNISQLFSVIIPLYNQGIYLKDSVNSVLGQTYTNFEIIIVNDGSTDDSLNIALELEKSNNKIRVINQKNKGKGYTRNKGVKESSGDYICILDADDMIASTYLEKSLQYFESDKNLGWVIPQTFQFGSKHNNLHWTWNYNFIHSLIQCPAPVSAIYRKQVWTEVGGYCETMTDREDWDLWISAGELGWYGKTTDTVEFLYRKHDVRWGERSEINIASKKEIIMRHPWFYKNFTDQQLTSAATFHPTGVFPEHVLDKKAVSLVPKHSASKQEFTAAMSTIKQLYADRTDCSHGKRRVLFYFFKNVHIPILLPLYNALKAQNSDVEIAFSYLPPSSEIRAGLLPDEVRIIEQAGAPIYATPQEFHPDLTFIADSVYPWVEGCGKLVHVGHGVLSKGQYYTDTPTARREEFADMVCVPGKHHQAIMRRIISKPVVATGMCKLDDLFSGKISRASVIKQFGLPDDYRYVLFAPTFNDELSAIPFVQDRIGQVLPDDKTLLIIKLHPSTKPEYKEMYRALPSKDKRIIFADELDITPFLALCDVMISDVSSAMMEFAALDKPVILFNNPNWTSYQNYNPADIEFQWRDIGVQVSDLDEMRAAVSLCLQDPAVHADKRKKYTDLLFANKRGGNAAERIVKLALSLLEAEQDR